MKSDVSELIDRIEFCREKSRELGVKIAALANSSIKCWIIPFQAGAGEINAKMLSHPPVSVRQEVGMLVNEQRSILDALACALALRNRANNTKDVYFPILKSKDGFFEQLGRRKIKKLNEADRKAIENIKPWLPHENDPEDGNLILFQLHEADRVRKHQNLLRWACLGGVSPAGGGQIGFLQTKQIMFSELEKEENLAFFLVLHVNSKFRLRLFIKTPPCCVGFPLFNCCWISMMK